MRPYKKRTRTTKPNVYNTSSTITVLSHPVGDTKMELYTRVKGGDARIKHSQGERENKHFIQFSSIEKKSIREREKETQTAPLQETQIHTHNTHTTHFTRALSESKEQQLWHTFSALRNRRFSGQQSFSFALVQFVSPKSSFWRLR